MAHWRAAIPALVAEVLLTAFLWWAGAGAQELHLPGTAGVSGGRAAAVLQQWLAPWSYDSPASVRFGAEVPGQIGDAAGSDGIRYPELYATALQIRFAAVFAFFVPGALLLVRRLPPGARPDACRAARRSVVRGLVAGILAVTVTAPWLIASQGRAPCRGESQRDKARIPRDAAAGTARRRRLPRPCPLSSSESTMAAQPAPPEDGYRFDDLRALFVNCTLKPSPQLSHTQGLIDKSRAIMNARGVTTDEIRAVDHDIAPGVYPDMTEHGFTTDAWPALYEKVTAADILVLAGPIWLGDNSSVTKQIIERLYSCSSLLNSQGQYAYYGRVGGCLITGNEDGVKHCAMNVLYSLQHLGYTIPPQADAGWIGAAGPGPSYLDLGSGGPENDFTNRNTSFMTWNLMHMAALLKRVGGIPAHGNQRSEWDAGCRPGADNPEHR